MMMTLGTVRGLALGLFVAAVLAAAPLTARAEVPEASENTASKQAGDTEIQQELDKQLAARRKAMMEEADAALSETHAALQALDEGNSKEALEALARATGKLELLVAREPALALAPVDVDFITHDLYATPEAIRMAREEAKELLEAGKVQKARGLLSGLASEIIISVTNLPLATYPDAIKAVSPLIDEGKTEQAKTALHAALNTMVVTDQVISLPVLRARAALDEAEELVGKDEPTDEDKKRIDALVKQARDQLERAELLGYGDKKDHNQYREEIAELKSKIRGDEETKGVFAKLRKSLNGFRTSFSE